MSQWATISNALDAGDVVILPTETVYGIASRAGLPAAIGKIYALKGRDFDKPLAVCVRDITQAETLAVIDDVARDLMGKHWPGPLTLVLDAKAGIPIDPPALGEVNGVTTIALRCPDIDWVEYLDHPIALTSANQSGEPDAVLYADAVTAFGNKIKHGLTAAAPLSGAPSTIVRISNGNIETLRKGNLVISEATP